MTGSLFSLLIVVVVVVVKVVVVVNEAPHIVGQLYWVPHGILLVFNSRNPRKGPKKRHAETA
jgi:hypothetical protein